MAKKNGVKRSKSNQETPPQEREKDEALEPAAVLESGQTVSEPELQRRFAFKHVLNCKRWLEKHDIPYVTVNRIRWIRTDDVLAKMAELAKPHSQWRAEREARRERRPGT